MAERPALLATALCLSLGGCGGAVIPVPVPIPLPTLRPEPAGPEARLQEGHSLLAAGDAEGALRAFRLAAVTGAGEDALAPMGTASLSLGRLGQAERLLRRATETRPDDAAAWNNLGVVLLEAGRGREAREAFERALAAGGPEAVHENVRVAEGRAAAAAVTSATDTAAEPERPAAPPR